jgi:cbb3-type cytochrome oxidase cytochrome c subunit
VAKRKIDEQISYNWLFFLLAGGFAAVTFWAVYDETVTRREYKTYQEAFFKVDRDLNKDKVDAEKAKLDASSRYKELEQRKGELEADIRGPAKAAIEALQAELQTKTFAAFDKTQLYTFRKSELDELYYYFTVAKHDHLEDPNHAAKKQAYDEQKELLDAKQKKTDEADQGMVAAEAIKKEAQAKLDAAKHTKELLDIGKEMEALRRPLEEAERAYQRSVEKITPMFGAATEVVQQDLPELGKVDRCESCHLGAARGGFETVAQPEFRSHPMRRALLGIHPPEKFGCTSCHDGQGRATTKFYAHAPGPDEDAHAFHDHYWEYSLLKAPPKGDDTAFTGQEYMQAKCRGCHKTEWDLRSELSCEIDAECPADVQGRPMVCDVPKPIATEGAPHASVADAEAAALAASAQAAGASPAKFCLERQDPKTKNLDPAKDSDRKKIVDKAKLAYVELAPILSKGLKVIEEAGCFGCHPIEGYLSKPKPAPDLTRIASKANPWWMIEWIKDPKAFRPNTRMPRFWPEMLAPDAYPYPVDVAGQKKQQQDEATAMAAFLVSQSKGSSKYTFEVDAIPVPGDAKRGEELVGTLGCAGCHNVPVAAAKLDHKNRATHFDHGPDLANIGAKTSKEWIYSWVLNPRRYAPDTRMPNLRLSVQEASDVAEFLSTQTEGKTYAALQGVDLHDPALVKKGKDLVKYYGCFGCHKVEDFEELPGIGAELTEFGVKTVDRLDFGDYISDHNAQTWDKWTYNKIKHPRVYAYERTTLRMPQFDFTDDEIRALMVVLKGMRGEDALETQVLAKKLSPAEQAREEGREMMRWYNCYGCHNVDGHEGDLRQLTQYRGENAKFGPPPLGGEGEKTQPEWLFGFLKEPFLMRPLPKVRMPTFGFSDAESTTLVAMFSALDHATYPFRYYADVKPKTPEVARVGQALFAANQCQKCHLVGAVGGPIPEGVVAPNLVITKDRLRAEWVTHWLADPNSLQAGTAMPAFWLGANNSLELALGNSPEAKAILLGLSETFLAPFLKSKERQIEAVRDYLFALEAAPSQVSARVPAAPTPAPSQGALPGRRSTH